jgi:hypothetical protein
MAFLRPPESHSRNRAQRSSAPFVVDRQPATSSSRIVVCPIPHNVVGSRVPPVERPIGFHAWRRPTRPLITVVRRDEPAAR